MDESPSRYYCSECGQPHLLTPRPKFCSSCGKSVGFIERPDRKASVSIATRSGNVTSTDPLVSFFYLLLRDWVNPGDVEKVLHDVLTRDRAFFSNGWLAIYAKDIVSRFQRVQAEAESEHSTTRSE